MNPIIAAAAPYALNFIGGLFGGSRRGPSPSSLYGNLYSQILGGLPKFDTSGMYSQAMGGYDQSYRMQQLSNQERFRRLLGPNAFSLAEASSGKSAADRSKFLFGAQGDIRRLGFNADMQRAGLAANTAAALTGAEQQWYQAPSTFGRAAGATMMGAGQDMADSQRMDMMMQMLFPAEYKAWKESKKTNA